MRDGDVEFLGLDLGRCFDEGGGETGFDVPFDVAVEELDSGVVCNPTDGDGAVAGDLDGVATHGGSAGRSVVGKREPPPEREMSWKLWPCKWKGCALLSWLSRVNSTTEL